MLVLDLRGPLAGAVDFAFVAAVDGEGLSLEPPLGEAHGAGGAVLVQKVPHCTTLAVDGDLAIPGWDGEVGGVFAARATETATIAGTLDASGSGFRGGEGVAGHDEDPEQGESYAGAGRRGDPDPNGGDGGDGRVRLLGAVEGTADPAPSTGAWQD